MPPSISGSAAGTGTGAAAGTVMATPATFSYRPHTKVIVLVAKLQSNTT